MVKIRHAEAAARYADATAIGSAESFLDLQQRYVEAWQNAGRIILDAMQAVARRQVEIAEDGLRDFWTEPKAVPGEAPDTGEVLGRQLEQYQVLCQKAVQGSRELSDIMLKAQSEAMHALATGMTVDPAPSSTRKAA